MNKLILQANSKNSILRRYLIENNFKIIDESIVVDKGKIYEIIVCKFELLISDYSEKDLIFGPILRIKKDELFIEKWKNKLSFYEEILNNQITEDKKQEIEKEIKLIKEVLYES